MIMTTNDPQTELKKKGWTVEQEVGGYFVFRYGVKATESSFTSEPLAWEWLDGFLETIPAGCENVDNV